MPWLVIGIAPWNCLRRTWFIEQTEMVGSQQGRWTPWCRNADTSVIPEQEEMWSYRLDQAWASLIGSLGQFSGWKGLIQPSYYFDLKFHCTVNSWNMAIWNRSHFLHRWIYTNLCIYGVVKAEETRYQHRAWTSIALLEPTAQILLLFACSLICVCFCFVPVDFSISPVYNDACFHRTIMAQLKIIQHI